MSRVRKKKIDSISQPTSKKTKKTVDLAWKADDHIDSEEEEDDIHMGKDDDDEVEEEEALDAKRVRLARQYLQHLEGGDSDDSSSRDDSEDAESVNEDYDRLGSKLQRERLKREGALEREVADKVAIGLEEIRRSLPHAGGKRPSCGNASQWVDSGHMKLLRGHDLTPTCVSLQDSGEIAISGSKDHSVLLWDVENEKRTFTLCPTWKKDSNLNSSRTMGEVLSVACSDDGRYAAVGKRDATVSIYDIRNGKNSLVKTFTGHKGAVTCLSFRTQSLQLFSGSEDRCIRHYDLSELMYLETLYGHQFGVTDVDCHRKERPISVGRDRTARAWKLAEDTHLIFRGGARVSSADCVRMLKDDWYLTGHDDGHLGLWMTEKKRAVTNIAVAHGSVGGVGRGVCSIATLRGSDLAVTGSYDGYLRLWKAATGSTLETRSLKALAEIPLEGYVNGIAVGPKAKFCVVAVGQEPRLGRWNRVGKAKNRFGIVSLRPGDSGGDESSDDLQFESQEAMSSGEDSDSS